MARTALTAFALLACVAVTLAQVLPASQTDGQPRPVSAAGQKGGDLQTANSFYGGYYGGFGHPFYGGYGYGGYGYPGFYGHGFYGGYGYPFYG